MENSKGTNGSEAAASPCAKEDLRRAEEEVNLDLVDAKAALTKEDPLAKEEANPEEICPSDAQAACPDLSSEAVSSTEAIGAAEPEENPNFERLPDVVLLKVFQHLSLLEKLKTESVSKHWQRMVNFSLLRKTSFEIEEISSARSSLNCEELGINTAKVLKRFSDPATKACSLTRLDIGQPFDKEKYYLPSLGDYYFPMLESLITSLFPPFVLRCKNLRSFTATKITGSEFALIVKECSNLKVLSIEYLSTEDLIEALNKQDLDNPHARNITESYFQQATCSLESITISPALGQYFMENLVRTFPDLKEYTSTNFQERSHFEVMTDFMALRDLSLRVFDFGRIQYTALCSLVLYSYLFMPSEKILTSFTFHEEPSAQSKLAASLEELRVFWDFEPRHSERAITFAPVMKNFMACRKLKVLHFVTEIPPSYYMLKGRCDEDRCPDLGDLFTSNNFPCLEDLLLPCAHLRGADLRFHLPNLKRLSICGCWTHHDRADVASFANMVIRECPLLERLHIAWFEIDKEFFPPLSFSMATKPGPLELKVSRLCQFKHFQVCHDLDVDEHDDVDNSHDKCPEYLRFLEECTAREEVNLTFSFDIECRCAAMDPCQCPCCVS